MQAPKTNLTFFFVHIVNILCCRLLLNMIRHIKSRLTHWIKPPLRWRTFLYSLSALLLDLCISSSISISEMFWDHCSCCLRPLLSESSRNQFIDAEKTTLLITIKVFMEALRGFFVVCLEISPIHSWPLCLSLHKLSNSFFFKLKQKKRHL